MEELREMLMQVDVLLNSSSCSWSSLQARWRMIKTRLERLLESMENATESPVQESALLHGSISHTLKCIQEARSTGMAEGKLQAQSNLDRLIAKLDVHIRDVGIIKCRSNSSNTVIGDLLLSLELGSVESSTKGRSLASLIHMFNKDISAAIVASQCGAANVLCALLTSHELREDAAHALWKLASAPSTVTASWDKVVFLSLIKLVENGTTTSTKQTALLTIQVLVMKSSSSRLVDILLSRPVLTNACFSSPPAVQQIAVDVLKNLSTTSSCREDLVEQGVIPALLHVSNSTKATRLARQDAAIALSILCPPKCPPSKSPLVDRMPKTDSHTSKKRRLVWALIVQSKVRKRRNLSVSDSVLVQPNKAKTIIAKFVPGNKLLSILTANFKHASCQAPC